MSAPPSNPCIYHITHVDNLPAIIADGKLVSDAAMVARGGPSTAIGMSSIKLRRLSLPIGVLPGLNVGDCVPFYFCPRSIMLFVIHCANHPELTYRGGQEPIVHLEANLASVVGWAKRTNRRWAFSLSNAGSAYTEFRDDLKDLHHIDWDAVASTNFSAGSYTPSGNLVKEGKQAEFLLEDTFPGVWCSESAWPPRPSPRECARPSRTLPTSRRSRLNRAGTSEENTMEFTTGNILHADTEAIVNTVNCVGFMGRGIAAQFRRAYPENFKAYEAACKRKEIVPGRMFVFETGQLTNPRFIVNFPTKRHWRGASRLEDIESGLRALVAEVKQRGIKSIAIPPLGCGLGGLDWNDVRQLIERAFEALPEVRTVVFEPNGPGPEDTMAKTKKVPNMTPGRAALISLVEKYLAGLLDPSISLLEVHKLMYFAQEAGEPLRLRYVKAHYGPYAENLRHVLNAIEGYMLSGYRDGGDAPDKALELVPGVAVDARAVLKDHPDTLARIQRVSKLVEGFESSFGMELLATVHWVMKHEGKRGRDVIDGIRAWNLRKQMFTDGQILLAARRLTDEGWIPGASA